MENSVNISSNYFEMVMQDKAIVTLMVQETAPSKEQAKKAVKQKVMLLQKTFRSKKVESQIVSQSMQDEFEERDGEWKKTGRVTATTTVQGISYDFEALNEAVDSVEEKDIAVLQNVCTSISERTQQAKEQEFTRKAIEKFKEKALNVAGAFGFTEYELGQITIQSAAEQDGMRGGVRMMSVAASASLESTSRDEDSSQYISPRESKVYVNISGTIKLCMSN